MVLVSAFKTYCFGMDSSNSSTELDTINPAKPRVHHAGKLESLIYAKLLHKGENRAL